MIISKSSNSTNKTIYGLVTLFKLLFLVGNICPLKYMSLAVVQLPYVETAFSGVFDAAQV
jgi:hypothetical protein